ncbi:glycosyltransferase family 2 protein [Mesorhizobium shangrilense]|uniref:Glycosyltransferase n=1 Tax=Mesorhizobium shangrilense TaxID=460060 RepID=A0ABV2DCN5_9HYPH
MSRVAILIACYNRASMTLSVLEMLKQASACAPGHEIKVFLLDDGSTDGTGDLVREKYQNVKIIQGTGSLFWNRGMCAAYTAAASSSSEWDSYALMNDDLVTTPEMFLEILEAHLRENRVRPSIMVGSIESPEGELLYGGYFRLSWFSPLNIKRAQPNPTALTNVDTMNGNLVFVPGAIMNQLGGLNPVYHHAYGDIDLGYRARKIGCDILLYFKVVGATSKNKDIRNILLPLSIASRIKYLFGYPRGIYQYCSFVFDHGCKILLPLYLVNTILNRIKMSIWLS